MDSIQEREFEQFVVGSGRRLPRTAVLLVGDLGHAEDLVQIALERTARHWSRLDGAPEAYARVVLARLATDRWRRKNRRAPELFVEPPAKVDRQALDIAAEVVDRQALVAALRVLSARQRAVLVLRYFDDLSEQQTADTLGVSTGTVKTTASRAIARLRQIIPALDAERFTTEARS
jgi:RNA polymerase sigma-70 factor (sigma-E family)